MCYSISLSLNDLAALDAVTPGKGYFPYPQHAPKSTLFVPQSEVRYLALVSITKNNEAYFPSFQYTNDLNRIFSFTEKSFYFQKFFSMIIECVEIHFTTASVLPAIQSRWMQNSHPLHTRLSPYIDGQYSRFTKPSKIMSNVSFHEEAFHHLCEQFLQTIYQNALQRRNRFILKFIQWSLLELPRKREKEKEKEAAKQSMMKREQFEKWKGLDHESLMYRLNQLAAVSRDDAERETKESAEEIDVDAEAFGEEKTSEVCSSVTSTPPNEEEIRKEAKVEEINASKGRVHVKRVEAAAMIQSRKMGGTCNTKRVWRPSSTSSSFGKPLSKTPHAPPMTRDATVRRPGAVPSPMTAKPQTGRPSPLSKEGKEVKDTRLISIDENDKALSRPHSARPPLDVKETKECEDRTVSNDFTEISKSSSRSKGDEHNFINPLSIFRDEITSILSLFKEEIVSLKKELEEQKTQAAVLSSPVNHNIQALPSSLPKENSNKSLLINPVAEPVKVEELTKSIEAKEDISCEVDFGAMKLGSETAVDNIYDAELINLSSASLPASTRTSMLRISDNKVSTEDTASALLEQENHQLKSELENMQKKLESFETSLQQTQQMAQRIEEQKLQQLQEQWQQNTHQLLQSTTETARQQLLQEFQELFHAKEEEMLSLRSALSDTQVKMTKLESEKRKALDAGFNYASSSNLLLKFNAVEERLEKKFLAMTETKSEEVKKDEEEEESPLAAVARYFLPCSDKFSEKRYMDLPKKPPAAMEAKDVVKNGSEITSTQNPNVTKKTAEHKEIESTRVRKQSEVTVKPASSKVAGVVSDAPKVASTNLPSDSPLSDVAQYFLPQKLSEEQSPLASVSEYFPVAERTNSSDKRQSPISEHKRSEDVTKTANVPSKPSVSKKQPQPKEQPKEEQKSSSKPSSPAVPEVNGYYYDEDSPLGGVATYFLDQHSDDDESPLCGVAKYFLNHIEVSRSSPSSPKLPHVPKSPQGVKPTDKARLNYPGRGNSGKLTI